MLNVSEVFGSDNVAIKSDIVKATLFVPFLRGWLR